MSSHRHESLPSLEPGTVVGGCRIVRQLGRGGMGEVYLAEHLRLERPVAVKVLPRHQSDDRAVERFLREARMCSRIEHPNVVTIHDVGETEGLNYIIMQYVNGQNLAELAKSQGGRLPWEAAVKLIRAAAKGLIAVHQAGLIHRDIKPANIMLAADGRVLLMDFGLVRGEQDGELTRAGYILGTPAFMSPEQCQAQELDPRSDVYSLGATLYTLLAGRPPYVGNAMEIVAAILGPQRPKPVAEFAPGLPRDVSDVTARAMAYRAADRYPNAKTFATALGALLQRQRGAAPPDATLSGSESWIPTEVIPMLELIDTVVDDEPPDELARARPWLIGGGVVVVLLLIGLFINLAVNLPETTAPSPDPRGTENMVQIPRGAAELSNTEAELRAHIGPRVANANVLAGFVETAAKRAAPRVMVEEFWIDKYEVTNAEYAEFLRATGQTPPAHWNGNRPPAGKDRHPVVRVRHNDAAAYAAWAGKQLPTRAQWVRAYRGDGRQLFPWGNDAQIDQLNVSENPTFHTTSPVDATPQDISPFGVYNLVGNVSELLRERINDDGVEHVLTMGAAYDCSAYLYGVAPLIFYLGLDVQLPATGFRCVRETSH